MMIAVPRRWPGQDLSELTTAMKEKGDMASYASAIRLRGCSVPCTGRKQVCERSRWPTAPAPTSSTSSTPAGSTLPSPITSKRRRRQVQDGTRLLAVGAGTRMQAAPDIPTLTEMGYPTDIRSWWGALVPAATPRPIVDQLNAWFTQVVGAQETKTFLNGIASDPWVSTPNEAQAYFLEQIKDWGEYVRVAKIEPQG